MPVFEGGKHYPVTDASQRQVARGNHEVVGIPGVVVMSQAAANAAPVAAD